MQFEKQKQTPKSSEKNDNIARREFSIENLCNSKKKTQLVTSTYFGFTS